MRREAGETPYSGSSSSSAAQREQARRQTLVREGTSALEAGDRAMRNKDYEEAWKQYRTAADSIPDAYNTKQLHTHAIHGLCQAGTALAEQRIAEGRYTDAGTVLRIVVTDYDPGCKEAISILKHLEDPGLLQQDDHPAFSRERRAGEAIIRGGPRLLRHRSLRHGFQTV